MKDQSNFNNGREENPQLPGGMQRIYSDGEPLTTRSGLNLWLTESLLRGTPEEVYMDEIVVYYSLN